MRTKGALGRKPRKDKQINVRIQDWELEQLKDYAEYCQMTLSELMIAGAKLYYQRQQDIYDKVTEEVIII